jgi:hypothetical protein
MTGMVVGLMIKADKRKENARIPIAIRNIEAR